MAFLEYEIRMQEDRYIYVHTPITFRSVYLGSVRVLHRKKTRSKITEIRYF